MWMVEVEMPVALLSGSTLIIKGFCCFRLKRS